MSEYKQVKIGKLKLKGSAVKVKKLKKKRKHDESDQVSKDDIVFDDDAKSHNGWWSMNSFEKLNGGMVSIQTFNNAYIFAVDNGALTLGEDHGETDKGPKEEEIFTMIKVSENKVAFKSGYGREIF